METTAEILHEIWLTADGDMSDIERLFNQVLTSELPAEFYDEINTSKADKFAYFERIYNKYTVAPCEDVTPEDSEAWARECNPSLVRIF